MHSFRAFLINGSVRFSSLIPYILELKEERRLREFKCIWFPFFLFFKIHFFAHVYICIFIYMVALFRNDFLLLNSIFKKISRATPDTSAAGHNSMHVLNSG